MNRDLNYIISPEDANKTIWQFLKEHDFSHKVMTHLKNTEQSVLLNDTAVYFNTQLKSQDQLTIHLIEENKSEKIVPVPLPFEIIYEDEDILVVNKPADMPIHPSLNNYENTLANAIAYYYESKGLPFVFRCMNRLDRDTSGITILAKNMYSAAVLSSQVTSHTLKREYLAIVTGEVMQAGTITAPIARKDASTIEREVNITNGEPAITHYVPLACKTFDLPDESITYSLLRIRLETGRTHQIRVHMSFIGHPLPGDFLYNPDYRIVKRQALHSACLRFIHPVTKETMQFEAPLPPDLDIFS